MIYLIAKKKFFHSHSYKNVTIQTSQNLTVEQIEDIRTIALASPPKNVRKLASTSRDGALFIKINDIKSFTKRLRTTIGIAKPFDYYLKELENNIQLNEKPIITPKLLGYFSRTKGGIVQRAGLIFQNLQGHVGAGSFITENPKESELIIHSGLRLLRDLGAKNIFHMDPRLENMMLHPANKSKLFAIDFEHCYIGHPADKSMITGLTAGMFYKSGVEAKISESQFDELVLTEYSDLAHQSTFKEAYCLAKTRFIERNECRKAFLAGRL